jgi:neutral ceramidase
MRLNARAFFFVDRAGRSLALVSADLFALPGGLHAAVAQRVADRLSGLGGVSLPPQALVIAATHTHHGPGNFLTSRVYNQFGSSYSGFALELFEFLRDAIADVVVAAAADAIANPVPVALTVKTFKGDHSLIRNRGPTTFTLNQDRDEIVALLNGGDPEPDCRGLPGEPTDQWSDIAGCPRLKAVDRTLTVVEIERTGGLRPGPIGFLLFLAVHPTVLTADAQVYSPDFTGFAALALERRLSSPGRPVVVGFFNGAEGDIVPRRGTRDLRETSAKGAQLKAWVLAALADPKAIRITEPTIRIRAGSWRPTVRSEATCVDDDIEVHLSGKPTMGTAALGGAEGDRTLLFDLGWRDGVRDRPMGDQGVKQPSLDSQLVRALRFTADFAPPEIFPAAIPLSLVELGGLSLAVLPAELTTAQGLRIRSALGNKPHGQLELVGLANEYTSYCSTADEYVAQDYMGASTIWGPMEGRYLECRFRGLAASSDTSLFGSIAERRFWPGSGPLESFGPAFAGEVARADEGLERIVRTASGLPDRSLPWFAWTEAIADPSTPLTSPSRTVTMWELGADGWRPVRSELSGDRPEDDQGPGLLTMYLGKGTWSAMWLGANDYPGAGPFAFVTYTDDGRTLCSEPFPKGAAGKAVRQAASCSNYSHVDFWR